MLLSISVVEEAGSGPRSEVQLTFTEAEVQLAFIQR
jgi:hypothetical protein